jgi:hypothetical protein
MVGYADAETAKILERVRMGAEIEECDDCLDTETGQVYPRSKKRRG